MMLESDSLHRTWPVNQPQKDMVVLGTKMTKHVQSGSYPYKLYIELIEHVEIGLMTN